MYNDFKGIKRKLFKNFAIRNHLRKVGLSAILLTNTNTLYEHLKTIRQSRNKSVAFPTRLKMLLLAAVLCFALVIDTCVSSPVTTEGPNLAGSLRQAPTQLDGCCFTALQAMLNHVAAHQIEWDTCERAQLNNAHKGQKTIESQLGDLQAKLVKSESFPEPKPKTNVSIPANFQKIGSKYYYIEKQKDKKQDWFGAASMCRQMGANLVRIESANEQHALEDHFQHREVYWLDTTDLATEGQFVHTSTGQPAGFLNWGYGEPDNYDNYQHCIFLYNGWYYDSHCDTKCLFICQAN